MSSVCRDWSLGLNTVVLSWHHSVETRIMAVGCDETIGVSVCHSKTTAHGIACDETIGVGCGSEG